MKTDKHIGSTFADFLADEGIADEVNAVALKRVLAWQIEEAMRARGISKSEMARRMKTSRSQLDRLLDPENDKVLLQTLHKAATVVGKRLVLALEDFPRKVA